MTEAVQNLLQQFINGIQTGAVYALIAIGYTMVYGVLKFINFAHGDVYMVGAYIGYFAIGGFLLHYNPALQDVAALIICMAGCAALGAFIERLAYRPLRNGLTKGDAWPWALFWALYAGLFGGPSLEAHSGLNSVGAFAVAAVIGFALLLPAFFVLFNYLGKRLQPTNSRLNALITAIGISLLIENQWQASFTATPQQYPDQGFKAVNLHAGVIQLNVNGGRIAMLVIAVLLTALLVYIVRYTRTGRAIRAVSLDPEAAALQGIPTDRIIAITFLIGASLAGAAGFLNHNLGQIYFKPDVGVQLGLKAFVAAVLGGIGSIEGAVLGALLMGLAESYVGGSSLSAFKNAIAFVILTAVLLFRPSGLMGRHVPEKV
ncbi:MAG TPA: branched-chain amino acid ABC transporter permease [Chthonomonadaceae bacterium]|nr:branched-chain amino acid ABC transporter permease [Chthonomonadaceae bacterium]